MVYYDYLKEILTNLSGLQIFSAAIVLFLASVVRGLTGFGFSAIIVTGLSYVFPPSQTVILALLLEIAASIHMLPSVWRKVDWALMGALGVGVVLATPIGMYLLAWLNPDIMRLLISSVVLMFALLLFKGITYSGPRTMTLHGSLGFVTGICNGTAALGGLPLVTFLLSTDAKIATTRATLIATFFATDLYALVFAKGHGMLNGTIIVYAVTSLPLLITGVALGKRLFSLASLVFFKKTALILLLVLSSIGILRALMILL